MSITREDVAEQIKADIQEELNKWNSRNLYNAWVILQMPDWKDGEPYLGESDIKELMELVLATEEEIASMTER